jgi:hypothetical protein
VPFSSKRRAKTKPVGAKRAAAIFAVVGAFIMSSGLVLLVSAGTAQAEGTPVVVCHATGSDSNPYNTEHPDADSTALAGHEGHRTDTPFTWKDAGFWNGIWHEAGAPKHDYISSYTDNENVFHEEDGAGITDAFCAAQVTGPITVVGAITHSQADCPSGVETWGTSGDHMSFSPANGTVTPGETVTSTATITDPGYQFADGSTSKVLSYTNTFDPETACVVAPTIVTPAVTLTQPTCTTSADWAGVDTDDITYTLESGTPGNGSTITVLATAHSGFAFDAEGTTTTTITKVFDTYDAEACPVSGPQTVDTVAPTFTDATCTTPDASAVNLPTVAGVDYSTTGDAAPGNTVTVDAAAQEGKVLTEGDVTHWSHTFATPADCETVVSPPKAHTNTPAAPAADAPVVIPTAVHAGLAGTPATSFSAITASNGGLRDLGIAMTALGGLIVAGACWLGVGRRNRGLAG